MSKNITQPAKFVIALAVGALLPMPMKVGCPMTIHSRITVNRIASFQGCFIVLCLMVLYLVSIELTIIIKVMGK